VSAALLSAAAIAAVPSSLWRRLGDALRDAAVNTSHERVFALSEVSFEPAFRALRKRILREADDRAARLLRMFWLGDPVGDADARGALGDALASELEQASILERVEGGLVSPFVLMRFMGDFLLAEDLRRGGDAVMGVGLLTRSLVEAAGPVPLGSVLDLGAGAGAVSLALASACDRVVATDVNPRATALTLANAAMRGVENIETRTGDLFAPVDGERFACVLFQPPFVPGWRGASFAEGGARGDELSRRAFVEAPQHLAPGGIAVVVGELPVVDDTSVEVAVAALAAPDINVLVVDRGATDLDMFAVGVTAHEHPEFGPAFDEAVVARRAHFERMRISELRSVMVVLSRANGQGFSATFDLSRPGASFTRRDIDSLSRSLTLLARVHEALGATRLRLRSGVLLGRLADGSTLVHAGSAPIQLEGMGPEMSKLVDALRAGKPVGETIRKLTPGPASAGARPGLLAATEQLLRTGLLEVAS
jgi:SAM-dependent methyltransferase